MNEGKTWWCLLIKKRDVQSCTDYFGFELLSQTETVSYPKFSLDLCQGDRQLKLFS